jgi:hypothetical protein
MLGSATLVVLEVRVVVVLEDALVVDPVVLPGTSPLSISTAPQFPMNPNALKVVMASS